MFDGCVICVICVICISAQHLIAKGNRGKFVIALQKIDEPNRFFIFSNIRKSRQKTAQPVCQSRHSAEKQTLGRNIFLPINLASLIHSASNY